MPQSNLADAELFIGVKEAAAELGIDIVTRMEKVGLSPKLLQKPEGFISWPRFNDLLEVIAKEDRCHYFGLLVGKHQPAAHGQPDEDCQCGEGRRRPSADTRREAPQHEESDGHVDEAESQPGAEVAEEGQQD